MVQAVTRRFRDTASNGGKPLTVVTCAPPGGEPVALEWTSGSVACDLASASRYAASLQLAPSDRFDVFDLVTTPGALFAIDTGFDYGAGYTELVGMGRYEVATDGADLFGGNVSVDLIDFWARLERDSYIGPFTPGEGERAAIIAAAVLETIPTVEVRILANGGMFVPDGELSWDSRTAMIGDMATDGGLDCYFDGLGVFVIRQQPTINLATPVWSFVTGSASNIATAERSRPFDRFYNRVAVLPMDEMQTWSAQIVELTDVNHPLHKSKYGVSTKVYRSPTLDTAEAAFAAGMTILQHVHGSPETLSVGSWGMSALEAGDTVSVVTERTETSREYGATHLLESFTFDLATCGSSAATRSSDRAEMDEVA